MKPVKKNEQKPGYMLDTTIFPVTAKSKFEEKNFFRHKNVKEQKAKYRNIFNKIGRKADGNLLQLTDKIHKFQTEYI